MDIGNLNNQSESAGVDIIDLLKQNSSVLPKRYKLMDLIDKSEKTSTFLVRDTITTRRIAVKILSKEKQDTLTQDEFSREAQIVAILEHPNIIPVHDISIDPDKSLFYTMKLLDGQSLSTILNKLRYKDPIYQKDYSLNLLLQYFLKVCEGVRFSHSKKVLNLDLNTSSIQVGKLGEIYIKNWTQARFLGGNKSLGSNTVHNLMIKNPIKNKTISGKPGFIAPEQVEDPMASDYWTERTDIFSLGAILYNILTLTIPFKGQDDEQTLKNTVNCEYKSIAENTNWLNIDDLILITEKAMQKDPIKRYATVKYFMEDLSRFIRGEETNVNPDKGLKRILRTFHKSPVH